MKELTQMRGDSLLFIQDKGTLIGYKVTKEVFAGICEQFIDLKKRPKNLLFEKQQGCEDGIRLIEGNVTVFVPSTSIRFSFKIANVGDEEKAKEVPAATPEEEEPENVPCKACGRTDLDLHEDRTCPVCRQEAETRQANRDAHAQDYPEDARARSFDGGF